MGAEDKLAAEVRAELAGAAAMSEVKMFGGFGFLLNGNLVAAVSRRGLLLRVGKDRYAEAVARPGAGPMKMRGRPVEGYIRVDPAALETPNRSALRAWLREAAAFAATLPPKAGDAANKAKRKRKGGSA